MAKLVEVTDTAAGGSIGMVDASALFGASNSQAVFYTNGAAAQPTGTTLKVQWASSGGNAPVIVGSDIAAFGAGDPGKIVLVTGGVYALTLQAAGYTISAAAPGGGAEGTVETVCVFPRLQGSNSALLDPALLNYVRGGRNGFALAYATVLRFAAGDTFYMNVICDTPTDSHASGTTNASPVVVDPYIQNRDLGKPVTGTGVPASTYVGTVTAGVGYRLSSAKFPVAQADVNATATGSPVLQIGPDVWNLEGGVTLAKIVKLAA